MTTETKCLACGHVHDWDNMIPINIRYCHREIGDGSHRCGCTEWAHDIAALRVENERLKAMLSGTTMLLEKLSGDPVTFMADAALGAGLRRLVAAGFQIEDRCGCCALKTINDNLDAALAAAVKALEEK